MSPIGSLRQNSVQFKLQTLSKTATLASCREPPCGKKQPAQEVSVKLLVIVSFDGRSDKVQTTNVRASVIVSFVSSNEEEHCQNSPFWCFSLGSVSRPGANKHSGLVAMTRHGQP
jgi:hypothetical protein